MTTPLRSIAALVLLWTSFAASPARPAEERCVEDWSVAAPIVKAEKLATVEELIHKAGQHLRGAVILKTLLCEGSDDRWLYRLVVRERSGQLRALTVDARRPFGD